MLVVTQKRPLDFKMIQQLSSMPGILTQYHVRFFEYAQRPQRDILEIANRSGDKIQRAGSFKHSDVNVILQARRLFLPWLW